MIFGDRLFRPAAETTPRMFCKEFVLAPFAVSDFDFSARDPGHRSVPSRGCHGGARPDHRGGSCGFCDADAGCLSLKGVHPLMGYGGVVSVKISIPRNSTLTLGVVRSISTSHQYHSDSVG